MRPIFVIGIFFSILLFVLTLEFSRREQLSREGSLLWLSVSIGLGVFSFLPTTIRTLARIVGLSFTYVFTSTFSIFVLLILLLYAYTEIKTNQRHIKQLTQELALLKTKIKQESRKTS